MAYVTSTNVTARIGTAKAAQLTTDSGTSPDTTKIAAIIAESEGDVNNKLAMRYTVPIVQATYPLAFDFVVSCVIRVAVYRVYALRPPVPEDIRKMNDDAMAALQDIADGTANLPDEALVGEGAATWDSIAPTGDPYDRDLDSELSV